MEINVLVYDGGMGMQAGGNVLAAGGLSIGTLTYRASRDLW